MNATEKRQLVEALLHAGHSDLDIHRQTGAARTTIARYRKALGLPGYRVTADSPACRHGHPFPENVAYDSNGWLVCRECRRVHGREQHARHYVPVQPDETAAGKRYAAIAECDVQGASARAIADEVGCSPRTVHRARSKRRASGDDWTWSPPEPDEAAVERAAAGDPPENLGPAERHAAIAQCDRWGLPARVTAERVGCTRQTVYYARNQAA
jgi:hypothetical protein